VSVLQASALAGKGRLPVLTFANEADMDRWLTVGPAVAGAWIRFAKKGASWPCLTKRAASDVALCHRMITSLA
jgi:hypothetical protein